jgi:hypothetical protein
LAYRGFGANQGDDGWVAAELVQAAATAGPPGPAVSARLRWSTGMPLVPTANASDRPASGSDPISTVSTGFLDSSDAQIVPPQARGRGPGIFQSLRRAAVGLAWAAASLGRTATTTARTSAPAARATVSSSGTSGRPRFPADARRPARPRARTQCPPGCRRRARPSSGYPPATRRYYEPGRG